MFHRAIARVMPLMPRALTGMVARRHIAGDDAGAARKAVERLHDEGMLATLTVLSDPSETQSAADKAVDEYCDLLAMLPTWRGGRGAGISLEPSQFGLKFDPEGCEQRIGWIVDRAADQGIFVRLGTEGSSTTDATLRMYRGLRARHPGMVGCVLQAALFRTRNDVASMLGKRDHDVSLCKAVAAESPAIAWQERHGVRDNFLFLAKMLWGGGVHARVATHDTGLIEGLLRAARELDLGAPQVEFQALLGVPIGMTLRRLRDAGHPVRIYLPFGPSWYDWAMRRLRQNPAVVGAITKSLLARER